MKETKKELQDPQNVELLDLWNEVGGQLTIEYHGATIKPTKEDLQTMREKGFTTDVMTCIMAELIGHLGEKRTMEFLTSADRASAAPTVTFEAGDNEALNITGKEENPILDSLVQAVETSN